MCGRLNIIDDPLCQLVSDTLGISFSTKSNNDLRPSEEISAITSDGVSYEQIQTHWGIKPQWSKKLLINAQSETVVSKPTFKHAFEFNRCVVPCSGWYEWRTENNKKTKYYFTHNLQQPLYMAGVWYPEDSGKLVTLTTLPNKKCAQYHKRMPVFILPDDLPYWFGSSYDKIQPLFSAIDSSLVKVSRA